MEYRDAKQYAWQSDDEIAGLFCVSRSTVRGWWRDNHAPIGVIVSLMLMGGWVPSVEMKRTKWIGWRFAYGYIWSPAGERFTSGDLRASRIDRELVDRLMIENQRLRRDLEKRKVLQDGAEIVPFPVSRIYRNIG